MDPRRGVGAAVLSLVVVLPGLEAASDGAMPTEATFENSIGMRFVRI
jgi:hypothetical protein